MKYIDRYNQGFGKFGPMEQCTEGKWCKSEQVDELIADNNDNYWLNNSARNELRRVKSEFTIVTVALIAVTIYAVALTVILVPNWSL
jgi:hypothetical protein